LPTKPLFARVGNVPIYTKTGDKGITGLPGGKRLAKSNALFAILGTIDELNAHLGFAGSLKIVKQIQKELFELGASIAGGSKFAGDVTELEKHIDVIDKKLPPLRNFILPGGTLEASHLHLARTVCRRLERLLAKTPQKYIKKGILKYVNRLSDLLFVLARNANYTSKVSDIIWKKSQ